MARTAPSEQDPFALGMVLTIDPRFTYSLGAWPGANRGIFIRTLNGGLISKIAVDIGVSSGNLSVAAYENTGVGRLAVPTGAPLASSGVVASPGTGLQEIGLGSSVNLAPGDWLFLACDNTTATFGRHIYATAAFNPGLAARQDSAVPAPIVATLAATSYVPILLGYP